MNEIMSTSSNNQLGMVEETVIRNKGQDIFGKTVSAR